MRAQSSSQKFRHGFSSGERCNRVTQATDSSQGAAENRTAPDPEYRRRRNPACPKIWGKEFSQFLKTQMLTRLVECYLLVFVMTLPEYLFGGAKCASVDAAGGKARNKFEFLS